MIIAEPVGSCTDLSATIMQPLKQYWNTELKISPLTVLADPNRLVSILNGGNGGLHPDAAYIYKKQLEESDIILLSKSDVLKREETAVLRQRLSDAFPGATVLSASAQTGEGMDKWIEAVMSRQDAGKRLLEIDYDTYAHGEAVLGWLNGTLQLHGVSDDWDDFLKTLMKGFAVKFDEAGCAVGHVKVIAENGKRFAVGNLTGKQDTLSLRGSAGAGEDLKLIINARVETTPELLDQMVREVLIGMIDGKYEEEVVAWRFLQPVVPTRPIVRASSVVSAIRSMMISSSCIHLWRNENRMEGLF